MTMTNNKNTDKPMAECFTEVCECCKKFLGERMDWSEEEFDNHPDREPGYDSDGQWFCPKCRSESDGPCERCKSEWCEQDKEHGNHKLWESNDGKEYICRDCVLKEDEIEDNCKELLDYIKAKPKMLNYADIPEADKQELKAALKALGVKME